MPVVQLSTKGQMIIPIGIRKKYGLKPKSKVEVIDLDNEILIYPIPEDPIEEAEGFLTSNRSVKEMVREAKEEEKRFEEEKIKRFRR